MKRPHFSPCPSRSPCLCCAGGLLTRSPGAVAAPAPEPVNVLFIITEQQRWDAMGCAGNPVLKTPNMDKLAQEGARFTRFYSACPVCALAPTIRVFSLCPLVFERSIVTELAGYSSFRTEVFHCSL